MIKNRIFDWNVVLNGQGETTSNEKEELSIISRYLIDLAKSYSNFYNENKIINENKQLQNARIYLT